MGNYDQGCGKGTAKRRGLHRQAPPSRSPAGAPPAGSAGRAPRQAVTIGQDLQLAKVWYQKVRFMSEGWYPIFSEGRSGTKKCEKTLRMVRLVPAPKDPDQNAAV